MLNETVWSENMNVEKYSEATNLKPITKQQQNTKSF